MSGGCSCENLPRLGALRKGPAAGVGGRLWRRKVEPWWESLREGDIDPDATKRGLQVEITDDDPAVFTTPWSDS
jgi:hypothetical protein